MIEPKYKLIPAGRVRLHRTLMRKRGQKAFLQRLQALRDIPEHGVKAGDLGGYVTKKVKLSHEGSCWIGEEAQVLGDVTITDNVYIGDNATINASYTSWNYMYPGNLLISDNVRITGSVLIELYHFSEKIPAQNKTIQGNVVITDNASLLNPSQIKGDVKIHGAATVGSHSILTDFTEIFGNVTIDESCKITGSSKILEHARLGKNVIVIDSVIAEYTDILNDQKVFNGKLYTGTIGTSMESLESTPIGTQESPMQRKLEETVQSAVGNAFLRAFQEIQDSISEYETDIVKIIKYPVMTDRTDAYTQEMVLALNSAKRLAGEPDTADFKQAIKDLERAFLAAESNALKIASTHLSEKEKKKTEKARDLFRVASNEASSEQEKKAAFIQGFKQLEGILVIPEIAVDTFRVKIGLKELEELSLGENND